VETAHNSKGHVLIVDDNAENRDLLFAKLSVDGYDVSTAINGVDALEKVKSRHPDIILMDVMMPVMDGYETCRRLKEDESTAYIPIVLLTAKGELEDKVMGLEVGAEDYLVKPYSVIEVSARVKSLLRMRALQAKLTNTEKMAALGEMVDGIAHELRNPLVTIGGMARRLYDNETDESHKKYLKTILGSVERMERMAKRVDEYKGILVSHFQAGNLNDTVTKAVDEARQLASGKDINFTVELMSVSPPVKMDSAHIKLAVLSVIENAVEAIEKKGKIEVGTVQDGSVVTVTVKDNGIGIEPEELRSIFNPFQTSKMTGAGMGLTIAYRIVQDHKGSIDIKSEPGRGTEVSISIPRGTLR